MLFPGCRGGMNINRPGRSPGKPHRRDDRNEANLQAPRTHQDHGGASLGPGARRSRLAESVSTTTYGVAGKSFVRTVGAPIALPTSPPTYSQLNFNHTSDPAFSGGTVSTTQPTQVHAEAAVLLRKPQGGGSATVICDMRVSGLDLSYRYKANLTDAAGVETVATLPVVGSFSALPANAQNNVGVRCWSPQRNDVTIEKADMHAVFYANTPTQTP